MDLTPARLLDSLRRLPAATAYRVALSGGLDSTVLLHALAAARDEGGATPAFQLSAVHVHHGLHGQADAWAGHCSELCARLGVPCRVLRVDARPAAGESPEAAARRARYSALAETLSSGEGLLTAHHQDDQAETLVLQLLRGAGPRGLAAMPTWAPFAGGWLGRPLLDWSRPQLHAYAQAAQLSWVDDPSNADTGLARNFLRYDILPSIERYWPAAARTLARAAAHQAEAAEILAQCAEADLDGALRSDGSLSIEALGALGPARQHNLLRHWLSGLGLSLPDATHLQRIVDEVIAARPDGEPRVAWGGQRGHCAVEIRRYRGRLYALTPAALQPGLGTSRWSEEGMAERPLSLPYPAGRLVAKPVVGAGLRVEDCHSRSMTVRFRCGGEVCRPVGRGGHTHTLKKLFQEWGVPPWERARVPLIYLGDDLAQVVGYCLCEPYVARGEEPGWAISVSQALPHEPAAVNPQAGGSKD